MEGPARASEPRLVGDKPCGIGRADGADFTEAVIPGLGWPVQGEEEAYGRLPENFLEDEGYQIEWWGPVVLCFGQCLLKQIDSRRAWAPILAVELSTDRWVVIREPIDSWLSGL